MNAVLAAGVALPRNAVLGIAFLVLGVAATFLMYHLWGHPYDERTRTSAAPRWAMWLHRGIGYGFAIVYVAIMWDMVPRIWTYQVELPARTVAHVMLGFTIGFLLIVKISIMRFFRHFEEWMPYLGTTILLCTVLLLGLSLPGWFRERAWAHGAPGGDPYSAASRARVARLLPEAGLPDEAKFDELAGERALRGGRDVLLGHCVRCHDLKTILDRPRTPEGWWSTVERMAEKPALFGPLTDEQMFRVTAYLVAITPELQRSVKRRRAEEVARGDARDETSDVTGEEPAAPITDADAGVPAAEADAGTGVPPPDAGVPAGVPPSSAAKPPPPPIDPARARATFERKCSQCHELSDVDENPPRSKSAARALIRRMIDENELVLSRRDFDLILWWLDAHYVRKVE